MTDPAPTPSPDPAPSGWDQMSRKGHGGWLLAGAPAVFGGLGWVADRSFGSAPWLLMAGVLYGLVGAVVKLVMDYRRDMAENSRSARWATAVRESAGAHP